jgi:hypothetical protein
MRRSEADVDICCVLRPGFLERNDVKRRKNLLAARRFPVRRYGSTPRAQYNGAVCESSASYQEYSREASVDGESWLPRRRWRSASYGSRSGSQLEYIVMVQTPQTYHRRIRFQQHGESPDRLRDTLPNLSSSLSSRPRTSSWLAHLWGMPSVDPRAFPCCSHPALPRPC